MHRFIFRNFYKNSVYLTQMLIFQSNEFTIFSLLIWQSKYMRSLSNYTEPLAFRVDHTQADEWDRVGRIPRSTYFSADQDG